MLTAKVTPRGDFSVIAKRDAPGSVEMGRRCPGQTNVQVQRVRVGVGVNAGTLDELFGQEGLVLRVPRRELQVEGVHDRPGQLAGARRGFVSGGVERVAIIGKEVVAGVLCSRLMAGLCGVG